MNFKLILLIILTMGLFGKLFGQTTDKKEIRLKYNFLQQIELKSSQKYEASKLYKFIETGILKKVLIKTCFK